ncbi:arsenate reductase ArsC [Aquabacter sp. P-9]|uniref:arsenate reductase ArsC n=1 Tax=Aquabacter sediminis TaxID=3029197 RepID=UPI00237D3619|nr:arsenate reductase ArsC [Aquabacter sp. P-9]MDE1569328.1 arsenate reductase ArsC [Aquabacter sp. P-9]
MTGAEAVAPYTVLFICNTNAGRSLIAEAILRQEASGHFTAYSAGVNPAHQADPYAIETLVAEDVPVAGLQPKPLSDFTGPDAPELDFVFTLCDESAGEPMPEWPGMPLTAHWSIEDAEHVDGSPIDHERAFETVFHHIRNRVLAFAALPLRSLDRLSLHSHMQAIGAGTHAPAAIER